MTGGFAARSRKVAALRTRTSSAWLLPDRRRVSLTGRISTGERKIRVAIVAPSLRILGGQAVQAGRLLSSWHGDPDVEAWLVPVNPIPPRPFRSLLRVKYARTLVTELTYIPLLTRELARADVVHVFSASYASFLLAPLPAVLIGQALRRPIVLNYHSGEAPDHLRRSAIARRVLTRVESNIVPSSFLAAVFRDFGITAAVIPNVVDLDQFPFRARNPLRPRLVSTRNFDALYNVACTIRAFRIVQDRRPDASLVLVGGGPQEAMLRRLAADLNLRNVSFAGRESPEAIARCYAANDIYIQSPNIDNMPVSVMEAFASGLPVVSTDAGGVPAILTHGEHGLLASLDDHRMLAAHVLRLLDDAPYAQRLVRAAYTRCQAWVWPAVRDQWLAAYRSVLSYSAESAVGEHATGSAPTQP
jgi:L-malate glycosyltransferase